MVGASAFMTQFSSWTFTGAAGKAYTDGLAVAFIFVGNALGFFFNYLYFAPRFRQMRSGCALAKRTNKSLRGLTCSPAH